MNAFPDIPADARVGSDSLAFCAALSSNGPAADRASRMMLYGQFVGSWDGRLVVHRPDGERFETSCEVHFGWALAGRAVQDVCSFSASRFAMTFFSCASC